MRRPLLLAGLALSVVVASGIDLALGRGFGLRAIGAALADPAGTEARVVLMVRAPRVAASALVGAALGIAGHAIQSSVRNRLASPESIGVNPAAIGGMIVGLWTGLASADRPLTMVSAALVGGLVGGLAMSILGRLTQTVLIVIAGMLVSAALGGLTVIFLALYGGFGSIFRWIVGATDGVVWSAVAGSAPWIAAGVSVLLLGTGVLHVLETGDRHALGVGVPVGAARTVILLGAVLTCAGAVALAGAIVFVGLLVPHLSRRLVGVDPRWGLPCSALLGALLLTACDAAAQLASLAVVATPLSDRIGVPTGAVTALVGAAALVLVTRKEQPT